MSRRRSGGRRQMGSFQDMVEELARALGLDLDADDPGAVAAILDGLGEDGGFYHAGLADDADTDLGARSGVVVGTRADASKLAPRGPRAAAGTLTWLPPEAVQNSVAVDHANTSAQVRARLAHETVPRVREIAQGMGWVLKGLKREDILGQMVAYYADPAAARAAVERLAPTERALLALVGWASFTPSRGGVIDAVARLAPHVPALGSGELDVAPALHDLHRRGYMLISATQRGAPYVAPTMYPALFPIDALTPPAPAPRTPPAVTPDPVGAFLGAVLRLWALGPTPTESMLPAGVNFDPDTMEWPQLLPGREPHRGEVALRPGGPKQRVVSILPLGVPLGPRTLQAIGRAVGVDAAAFYVHLGIVLGIVMAEGNRRAQPRLVVDPERLVEWMALPVAQQASSLVWAWRASHYLLWSETSRLAGSGAAWDMVRRADAWQVDPNRVSEQFLGMRQAVMVWLRRLPVPDAIGSDGWVEARTAFRRLYDASPETFTPNFTTSGWGFRDRGGHLLLPGAQDTWDSVGWPLLSFIASGPLTWLGFVEADCAKDGSLRALRLARLGTALLADTPLPVAGAVDARWTDGGSVAVVPEGAAAPLAAVLAGHARLEGFRQDRLVWQLDATRVQARIEAGDTPADLLAPYTGLGVSPPAKVAAWFDRVAARWGLVNHYPDLAVITFADAITAREVVERTPLGRVCVYQVRDTCFVVEARQVAELVATMRALGHTPKVVEPDVPRSREKGRG